MEASWEPDPTGRHQYRWWDGVGWADTVADRGVTSKDPYDATSGRTERPLTTVTVSTTPAIGQPRPELPATQPYIPDRFPIPSGLAKLIAVGLVVLAGLGVGAYLLFFRSSGTPQASQTGVTLGHLSGPGSFVVRDVHLRAGDAIRYRVEGAHKRDLVTYLLASNETAHAFATAYMSEYATDLGLTDLGQITGQYTDAVDILTDAAVADAVRGDLIIKNSDRCCKGVPDTDTFIATVPGTYRIVVIEANGKDSDVRIVVEMYPAPLTAYSDISGASITDGFFTDSAFFKDTETYEIDSGT